MDYTELNARQDLVLGITEAWKVGPHKDVVLFGDNQLNPGVDKLDLFVHYEVEFKDCAQVTIAENPIDRTTGAVSFYVVSRQGAGVNKSLEIRNFLKALMKAEWYGKVRTMIPRPYRPFEAKGRYILRLDVPFRFDSRNIYGH